MVGSSAVSSTRSGERNSPVSTGGLRRARFLEQLVDRAHRLDAELRRAFFGADPAALEDDAGGLDPGRDAGRVALEDQLLAVVEAALREREHVLGHFLERVELEPLDQRAQPAVALEDVEDVVVPAVLADQPAPPLRRRLAACGARTRRNRSPSISSAPSRATIRGP